MPRYNDSDKLKIEQLREFARNLRVIADLCDSHVDMIDADAVEITMLKTGKQGIDKLSKFIGALGKAITASKLSLVAEPKVAYETIDAELKKENKSPSVKVTRKRKPKKKD